MAQSVCVLAVVCHVQLLVGNKCFPTRGVGGTGYPEAHVSSKWQQMSRLLLLGASSEESWRSRCKRHICDRAWVRPQRGKLTLLFQQFKSCTPQPLRAFLLFQHEEDSSYLMHVGFDWEVLQPFLLSHEQHGDFSSRLVHVSNPQIGPFQPVLQGTRGLNHGRQHGCKLLKETLPQVLPGLEERVCAFCLGLSNVTLCVWFNCFRDSFSGGSRRDSGSELGSRQPIAYDKSFLVSPNE
eukprot:2373357-Amphidinium_carterae.1